MTSARNFTRRYVLGATIGLAALAVAPAQAARRTLRGNVVFRSRDPLPREVRVTVQLVDVSLADAPAKTMAQTRFRADGDSPLPYELEYETRDIRPGRTYALQARIQRGDELLFTNTERHTIFGDGRQSTDIRVDRVGNDDSAEEQDDRRSPVGSWRAREIAGVELVRGSDVTLEIANRGKVTGSGGCNRYFSQARIGDGSIRFGQVGSTRMACAPRLMDQEASFFDALQSTRRFELRRGGRSLLLLNRRGETVARFSRG
jgi:putative lipoprotein